MAENLKAFENLKESTEGSLDSKEKAALNDLKETDIRSAKNSIGNKTFNVDGTSMTLKDIVSKLQFNSAGTEATLNGKKIGRGSELGAAIQVYVIAHNKDVGKFVIDGKVGKDTIKGIQGAQTEAKVDQNNRVPESGDKIGMKDFRTHVFTKEFNSLGKAQQMKNMKVLTEDGYLNISSINGLDCKFSYTSKVDGFVKSATIKIKKDVNDMVDCLDVAKSVYNKIDQQEKELDTSRKNNSAELGIDKFNENNITDPLLKKWVKLKKVNFEGDSWGNGRIQIRAVSGGKNIKQIMCNNTDVLTGGKFDSKKFNTILQKECRNLALDAVKQDIEDRNNANPQPSSINYVSVIDSQITYRESLIKEIEGYKGYENDLKGSKNAVKTTKEKYENQKNYLNEKSICDKAIAKINTLSTTSRSFVDNFDAIKKEMEKIVVIDKDKNVRFTYTVNYGTTRREAFEKVGKKAEYTKLADQVVNKWKNVKEGGDPKYDIKTINR